MNVGVNYMREHMPSTARIHYAVTDTGGTAPNVVQAHAAVRYLIRARELDELMPLVERVRNIARGAALMTETRMSERVVSGDANLIGNDPLEALMHAELLRLGPPQFDDQDREFAQAIRATLSPQDIRAAFSRFGLEPRMDLPLADDILPRSRGLGTSIGSTDVGTVSWVVPTVQMRGGDLCGRHAGPFLAARGAGQVRHRPQGHDPRRKSDGGDGQGAFRGSRENRGREGRLRQAPCGSSLRQPAARRRCARSPGSGGMRGACPRQKRLVAERFDSL